MVWEAKSPSILSWGTSIGGAARGLERLVAGTVSSTWWQPQTARELAVQPAACYYIRKLEAQSLKGRTHIKQMVAKQKKTKNTKCCSVPVCGAARLCEKGIRRNLLKCSNYAANDAHNKQAEWGARAFVLPKICLDLPCTNSVGNM